MNISFVSRYFASVSALTTFQLLFAKRIISIASVVFYGANMRKLAFIFSSCTALLFPITTNAGTFSGTSIFLDTITENGSTAQTIVDYNGTSRTAGSFYSDVITGSTSLGASSSTIFEPRLNASVW